MKVKLLKKLRKRFIFYYDREEIFGNPWKVYDKEQKQQCHFFRDGISYYSEQAQYKMMDLLCLLDHWSRIYDRKEVRRIARHRAEVSRIFESKEIKP